MILSTGLAWIVRSDNSPVDNKYHNVFSEETDKTDELFNTHIPNIMSQITGRLYLYREGPNRFIGRLAEDWPLLKAEFNFGDNRVSGLNISMGDLHGSGNQANFIRN